MAELKQCEFYLLRYVPDAVKDEFVNLGVVLLETGEDPALPPKEGGRTGHPRSKRGEGEPMNVSGAKVGGQTNKADWKSDLAANVGRLLPSYSLELLRPLVCLLHQS